MIKNKSFSPQVLWLENQMKKSPEQPERVGMFCYWLERDKDFWANYENELRERFGDGFSKPNRRKLIIEYFKKAETHWISGSENIDGGPYKSVRWADD